MAAVDEKVKQIIVEQLGVDEGEVTPSASFVDDLGADSLDTVREDPHGIGCDRVHRQTREGRQVIWLGGSSLRALE